METQRIENWEPYKQIHLLRCELLAAWANKARSAWDGKHVQAGLEGGRLYGRYRTAIFETAKYARQWGLDPTPIYDFTKIDGLPKHPKFEKLMSEVAHLALVCQNEAEARWKMTHGEEESNAPIDAVWFAFPKKDKSAMFDPPDETPRLGAPGPAFSKSPAMKIVTEAQAAWEKWYAFWKKRDYTKPMPRNDPEEWYGESDIGRGVRAAFEKLAVQARQWGMNPESIESLAECEMPKSAADNEAAQKTFNKFVRQYQNQAQAEYLKQVNTRDAAPPPVPIATTAIPAQPAPEKRKRKSTRRRRTASIKPLTKLQQQAFELHGLHRGTIKTIAAEMGIAHSTVIRHLNAAWRKLGLTPPKTVRHKTQALPTDHRGQSTV